MTIVNSAIYLYYCFEVHEKEYCNSQQVPTKFYKLEKELIGSKVKVKYSVKEPEFSELANNKFKI